MRLRDLLKRPTYRILEMPKPIKAQIAHRSKPRSWHGYGLVVGEWVSPAQRRKRFGKPASDPSELAEGETKRV